MPQATRFLKVVGIEPYSEWMKFNTVFKDHLLLSENELDDLQWQIHQMLNESNLVA
jgi:hypothetical protein